MSGQRHIIVFKQYDLACEALLFGNIIYMLYQILTGFIGRMGFAGKYDLNGCVFFIEQLPDAVDVPEYQCCPFICGEPSGKAYGKCFGIDGFAVPHHCTGHMTATDPFVHMLDGAFLKTHVSFPKFLIGDIFDIFPSAAFIYPGFPSFREILVKKLPQGG